MPMAGEMMRAALALCLLTSLLAGCDKFDSSRSVPDNTATTEAEVLRRSTGNERVRVWRDPETGCQYLALGRRRTGSLTPRLKADGRPMCGS
ncbi:DUF6440 family protein [Sphingomonas sp. Leaf25]|uniref:DUF6440 family protein n=1 Tax=Sphingomonas sp. Leaf25 TaxID=1735692 RepID=UPI002285C5D1|nr:DUF6440 family protein [Sphingomonas sp. Leaf25]